MDIATTILLIHVGIAAAWDLASRRIPNPLIVSGLLLGAALQLQGHGWGGLGAGLGGATTALLLLIGPFALRWMGGGDVKIAMVVGMFLGWSGAIHVILVGTVVHGLLGLLVMFSQRFRKPMDGKTPSPQQLPHAVGFAVAVVLYIAGMPRFI